jgi:hypothetical protein
VSPKSSNKRSCPADGEIESFLDAIRQRYALLTDEQCMRRVFLNRLRNMGRFGDEPVDYREPAEMELPKELEIGFAVCHPECGNQAFVVIDGGPQSCDACGSTMMPVAMAVYRKKKQA